MSWYKDRDFPEIKVPREGDTPLILVVTSQKADIERIIETHNEEIEALLARIQAIEAEKKTWGNELTTLIRIKAKMAELESHCMALREFLDGIADHSPMENMAVNPLSSDVGKLLIDRVRKLERVAEAARDFYLDCTHFGVSHTAKYASLGEALAEMD